MGFGERRREKEERWWERNSNVREKLSSAASCVHPNGALTPPPSGVWMRLQLSLPARARARALRF